jgi:hypothetical protein
MIVAHISARCSHGLNRASGAVVLTKNDEIITMLRRLAVLCGAVLISLGFGARANVIYDVTAQYSFTTTLQFSLELPDACASDPVCNALDLIGGVFQDVFFEGAAATARAPIFFQFTKATPGLIQFDFVMDFDPAHGFCGPDAHAARILGNLPFFQCAFGQTFDLVGLTVFERQQEQVPLPATLALFLVGLPALWLSRHIRARRAVSSAVRILQCQLFALIADVVRRAPNGGTGRGTVIPRYHLHGLQLVRGKIFSLSALAVFMMTASLNGILGVLPIQLTQSCAATASGSKARSMVCQSFHVFDNLASTQGVARGHRLCTTETNT